MHFLHKAIIRTSEGKYLETQNCNIVTDDIEYARQMLYAELQQDYLPQVIHIDVYYIHTSVKEEKFKLLGKIDNTSRRNNVNYIIYNDGL